MSAVIGILIAIGILIECRYTYCPSNSEIPND